MTGREWKRWKRQGKARLRRDDDGRKGNSNEGKDGMGRKGPLEIEPMYVGNQASGRGVRPLNGRKIPS